MSYPLIILGAGASHDFLKREDYPRADTGLDLWIPPMTNQLFNGVQFQTLIIKYHEMNEVVGYIRGKIRRSHPDTTFEGILTKLYQDGVKSSPELYKSFIALLFYLSELFGTITRNYYRPHNNYDSLKQIIRLNGNKAVFVNFNYDLLLERSLGKDGFESLDQYLSENFPIIKIHGAYNWFWNRFVNAFGDEKKDCYELSLNIAEALFKSDDSKQKWELVINTTKYPKNLRALKVDSLRAYSLHPAIALPLIGKNNFVCPPSHIDFLKNKLTEIDRIVIIGWKVADPFLKELLLDVLQSRTLPVAFVGGSGVDNTVKSLDQNLQKNIKLVNNKGFSDFVSSEDGENFFSN